jgi:hypothetical protein
MHNIYMKMPTVAGVRMPGIIAAGVQVQDDFNDVWRGFQAFVASGGVPHPFDATQQWDGDAYVRDTDLAAQALAEAKKLALHRVDAFHAEIVQSLVDNPTQVEKDTWALKLETADAIAAGAALSTAGEQFVTAAGLHDEAARQSWAQAVLVNAAAYARVVGRPSACATTPARPFAQPGRSRHRRHPDSTAAIGGEDGRRAATLTAMSSFTRPADLRMLDNYRWELLSAFEFTSASIRAPM